MSRKKSARIKPPMPTFGRKFQMPIRETSPRQIRAACHITKFEPASQSFCEDDLTAPFAIQRPAGIRIRKATLDELHVETIGPIEPEKSASPCGLSGTGGVSNVRFAPPASQTSVPIT